MTIGRHRIGLIAPRAAHAENPFGRYEMIAS
jgi:hypothetical protein